MRMCNISRGRVLQLTAMAYGAGLRRSGGERNPKCGNLRYILMRDSGMSGVFSGYSSKKRDGW